MREVTQMKHFSIKSVSTAANAGIACEHDLYFALTGKIREKHDHTPFDKGSDIEELHLSVKSSNATLASKLNGDSLEEMVADYFDRCASTAWGYVTKDRTAYLMNRVEFASFLNEFGTLDRASTKNGGQKIVRIKKESKKMLAWLSQC